MTLIKPKYTYEKLKRVEVDGKRRYAAPGGAPVASVTTILSGTKDMTHLIAWKKRVGEQKAQEIVTEASGVGTRMHKYLEDYIEFGDWPTPGSNPYAQQAHMMATKIKVHAMDDVDEIWGSEVPLYVPNIYAGTTDLVGQYKGNPCIMDFKQTNKPKKREWIDDYFMQAAAYGMAHNEVFETKIEHAAIFMCSRDCDWQLWEVGPEEFKVWEEKWANRVAEFYNLS